MNELKSALIGFPTRHSVSDIMFRKLFSYTNASELYTHNKIDVQESNLKKIIKELIDANYLGFNVTLPYKLIINKYVDFFDSSAKEAMAINTVKICNNTLIGYNTDWYGMYYPTLKILGKGNYNVSILGTGGACRAAILASRRLTSGNINVFYRCDPHISKATKELLKSQYKYNINMYSYDYFIKSLDNTKLIINATPVGMRGYNEFFPFNLNEILNQVDFHKKVLIDFVFNPVNTDLINVLSHGGCEIIDGLWIMLYQGLQALSIWTNHKIEILDYQIISLYNELKEKILKNEIDY